MNDPVSGWICPSCRQPLVLNERIWRCENNHSYDKAKEGYVNLLLAQHKNSKEPGDNKQMVNARRSFLEQGYYEPLAERVAGIIALHHAKPELTVFDAGCGEGYYLNHIVQVLKAEGKVCQSQGIDISKIAVQKAAKKHPKGLFAVASSYNLPIADSAQDAVLQVFAPSDPAEISRVLDPQGIWVIVSPGANHLYQLRQALYDTPSQHQRGESGFQQFELKERVTCSFELQLKDPQTRENLLMMTPYYWSASQQKKAALLNELEQATADFDIQVYIKK